MTYATCFMNNGDMQQQFAQMCQQMEQQQAQLAALLQQQARRENAEPEQELELLPQIAACIPPHLQLAPFEPAERKRILKRYAKIALPKCIKDDNGLAVHAIGADANIKKWVTERYPALQREHLDVVRIAAASWQHACSLRDTDPAAAAETLVSGMRDVIALSCESAQRAAQQQLKQTLDAAGQSSAYAMLDLTADTTQIDFNDSNVLQHAHLDIFSDLKDFRGAIESARPKRTGPTASSGRGSGNQGYQGGRGGGKGAKGGKGGGKGKGGEGGKGHTPASPASPNGAMDF